MMSVSTVRGSAPICAFPGCSKTAWRDSNGTFSAYCSRTHREKAAALSIDQTLCEHCGARPVYIENGRPLEFCGRRCATAYRNRTPSSPSTASTINECGLINCHRPVYVDQEGTSSKYCSHRHRRQAAQNGEAEECLLYVSANTARLPSLTASNSCGLDPKMKDGGKYIDFCSKTCKEDVISHAPIILQLRETHKAYKDVDTQFKNAWKHSITVPTVVQVWRIYGSKAINDRFLKYRQDVERRTGLTEGNNRRRWHGTIRACTLGDNDNLRDLCTSQSCSLCQIIRSSFQLARAGQRTNFGRFGAGIYTSATSSKANDYAVNSGGSPYKAMFLNEVVMGKGIKLTRDNVSLTEPPVGYDSVIGEPGGSLNYDESIVYTNDAIRPMFLVIYRG
ncbi:hypothetical protein SCP_1104140 [Sparassis crispa]|uniref:PARP catalytic domain-containing protein n=1 Tax=Sparassis crispa TaxID=139825 RepID=A0A401GZY9_9APHY|nr:hypothetical protein SCP_1104140 [Sparassis crispa]GBE87737.1 hypothetical protein SCP_1104140 [Sparassis crispa]